jgi:hypothetical protein
LIDSGAGCGSGIQATTIVISDYTGATNAFLFTALSTDSNGHWDSTGTGSAHLPD